jgi:predicted nucleic acid-binding Zn ribbon protein
VGDYLDGTTERMGVPRAGILGVVFSKWAELVGAEIADHAQPRSLRQGVLTVVVDEPAWAAQLRYLTSDLLARISAFTGTSEVAEIQFRVAGYEARSGREKSPGRPPFST